MNPFIIPVYGPDSTREDRAIQRQSDQRGDHGAAAIFVFSPNFRSIVTLYGNRFDNRKTPSGGIEDRDFWYTEERGGSPAKIHDDSLENAALRAALRELEEETPVRTTDLLLVAKSQVEDVIRTNKETGHRMMRYYFVAVAKTQMEIAPFRSKEDGKDHYVDRQRWESVIDVLRGATHEGETYNTHYSIALLRIIKEMIGLGYDADTDFRGLLEDLAYARIELDDQLTMLEVRRDRETEERRQSRRTY